MFFAIDPANGVAVYEQIVRQVKFAVAARRCKPGEMIPSVRELARELAINPNTVARAYRQLQTDGVLARSAAQGWKWPPAARDRCRRETVELIRARLRQVLIEAQQSRLERDELRRAGRSGTRARIHREGA